MFSDVFQHLTDHMDALKANGPIPSALDEIADKAAAAVEMELEEIDVRDNTGRDLGSKTYPVPAQDTVAIDITDSLQAETKYWGEGSFVQETHWGDVRVVVDCPTLYVVDADGNVIEGGRIMAEWTDIRTDTP